MIGLVLVSVAGNLAPSAPAPSAPAPPKLTVGQCAAIAVEGSADVEEAEARVKEYQARLAEIESIFYPKLFGMAAIAPMFSVDFNATRRDTTRRWKRLGDWGPYTFLEATLAQPLYAFGRAAAGEKAAREYVEVQRARLREAEIIVALEVHKLYYLYLYTQSILPSLDNAADTVAEVRETAQEMYDEATGEVTQVDLMKLQFGAVELNKLRLRARQGGMLALAALKHTMGWPAERELVLADRRLPKKIAAEDVDLVALMALAAENRPEWTQIAHGKRATLAWAEAEALATMPILFLAGQFRAAWTPTREDTNNPYHLDQYNDLFGGVALGIQFNIDPWNAFAREDQALATNAQVEALARFASTGIPLQVRKAHSDYLTTLEVAGLSKEGAKATKKWLAFSASAFLTGTGEAKDVLEGLVAYLSAKNAEYESQRDLFIARAELDMAVGLAPGLGRSEGAAQPVATPLP